MTLEEKKKKKKHPYYPEEYLVAIIMSAMLILCFMNVLARYVFNWPMTFVDALQSSIFPWVTFLGAPIACARAKNTALTLFSDMLPQKYQKYVELVTTILSVLLFSFLFYYGAVKTYGYFKYNNTLYELNDAPKWIFSLCIPIGSLLYIFRTIQVTVKAFIKDRKRRMGIEIEEEAQGGGVDLL